MATVVTGLQFAIIVSAAVWFAVFSLARAPLMTDIVSWITLVSVSGLEAYLAASLIRSDLSARKS